MSIEMTELSSESLQAMLIEEESMVKILGFETIDDYHTFKYHAAEGMIRFGGFFASRLGECLARADASNARKIIKTWINECHEHAVLHMVFIQKRDKQLKKDDENG